MWVYSTPQFQEFLRQVKSSEATELYALFLGAVCVLNNNGGNPGFEEFYEGAARAAF